MAGRANLTAECEPRRLEVLTEAYIEGNVGIVGVHVEVGVLAGLVLHHEAVVSVEPPALHREQPAREWLQVACQQGINGLVTTSMGVLRRRVNTSGSPRHRHRRALPMKRHALL